MTTIKLSELEQIAFQGNRPASRDGEGKTQGETSMTTNSDKAKILEQAAKIMHGEDYPQACTEQMRSVAKKIRTRDADPFERFARDKRFALCTTELVNDMPGVARSHFGHWKEALERIQYNQCSCAGVDRSHVSSCHVRIAREALERKP